MNYIDADRLKEEIKKFSATEYNDGTLGDDVANGALEYVLEKIIPSLQQEQPEVDLKKDEEEITDSTRACCNCISGAMRYPDCYCWLHEDCNTDEPYRIPKEDWVETAIKCKEFEFERKRDIR